jgi:hypothetical protein
VNYHRVLNRAAWSGREAARVLLGLLLDAFVPNRWYSQIAWWMTSAGKW